MIEFLKKLFGIRAPQLAKKPLTLEKILGRNYGSFPFKAMKVKDAQVSGSRNIVIGSVITVYEKSIFNEGLYRAKEGDARTSVRNYIAAWRPVETYILNTYMVEVSLSDGTRATFTAEDYFDFDDWGNSSYLLTGKEALLRNLKFKKHVKDVDNRWINTDQIVTIHEPKKIIEREADFLIHHHGWKELIR